MALAVTPVRESPGCLAPKTNKRPGALRHPDCATIVAGLHRARVRATPAAAERLQPLTKEVRPPSAPRLEAGKGESPQMSQFSKWARREYGVLARFGAMLLAGLVFVILLPYVLVVLAPAVDDKLGLDCFNRTAAAFIIGCLLMLAGYCLALCTILEQINRGRGTPLPMMPTQGLLTTGPFRYCRNPMTLGTIVAYLGMSIASATVTGVTLVLVLAALLITYLKRVEERELDERFGEPYLAYRRQVPFMIPRLRRRK